MGVKAGEDADYVIQLIQDNLWTPDWPVWVSIVLLILLIALGTTGCVAVSVYDVKVSSALSEIRPTSVAFYGVPAVGLALACYQVVEWGVIVSWIASLEWKAWSSLVGQTLMAVGAYMIALGVWPLLKADKPKRPTSGGKMSKPKTKTELTSESIAEADHLLGGLEPRWRKKEVSGVGPCGRVSHSAVLSDDSQTLYILFGAAPGKPLNDVYRFRIKTNTWELVKVPEDFKPEPRVSHAAVMYQNSIYVYGGGDGKTSYSSLHVLDTVFDRWSRPHCKGSTPPARSGHTLTYIREDMLLMFGGYSAITGYSSESYLYFIDSKKWKKAAVYGTVPTGRVGHTAVLVNEKLFVFGGSTKGVPLNDTYILDTVTYNWSSPRISGGVPLPRLGHSTCQVGTSVLLCLFGGKMLKEPQSDAYLFNTDLMKWQTLNIEGDTMPNGRLRHTTTMITGTSLYVFGGSDGKDHLNDLWVLDLVNPEKLAVAGETCTPDVHIDRILERSFSERTLTGRADDSEGEDEDEEEDEGQTVAVSVHRDGPSHSQVTDEGDETSTTAEGQRGDDSDDGNDK
eukprot:GFYU01001200.1.p1 GENE.GFYU01001200.1~~GFYU01001200.1.p1  ORF type:complete len:566 (-),score=134.77 GFYU01001200.1:41-1738(-)